MENNSKLPVDIKSKWITALRSGEYKQTTGRLHGETTGGYCCLGVLAHVCGYSSEELFLYKCLENNEFMNLPSIVKGPAYINPTVYRLTKMNDNEGKSFNEIADWIEQNL